MADFTGRLQAIQLDYITHKPVISFQVDQTPDGLEDLQEEDLSIKVGKHRKSRSLDSNAYFHVLCDKLRQKLGISMARCKNALIASYGQFEYVGDVPLIYKTNAPPEYISEREEVHMNLIRVCKDGAYMYRVFRGSHTYNSKEMAQLIEGTVSECKEQGIETATPAELARMAALWEKKHDKANRQSEER